MTNSQKQEVVKRIITTTGGYYKGQGIINFFCNELGLEKPYNMPMTVPPRGLMERKLKLIHNAFRAQLWTAENKPYKMNAGKVVWGR